MRWRRLGRVLTWDRPNAWWHSHTMAPSALDMEDGRIRVYIGCWDSEGISRIGWLDVDAQSPLDILEICRQPVLDIGMPGTFDENGVFPAHVASVGSEIRLYYTGFQLGHKVPHYNFGGVAVSGDGESFRRYSETPVLDRADEGLCVRAGISVLREEGVFRSVYSAGSAWVQTGGKPRPCYDVFHQLSEDGLHFGRAGNCIIKADSRVEHGLGRPQLVRVRGKLYVYYTRRVLGMKYFFGFAEETAPGSWERRDDRLGFAHTAGDFDSEMVYFPSVVHVRALDRYYLFYSGNGFGAAGMGVAVLDG